MGFNICKVNEQGLQAIKEFMLENHKRPSEATSDSALAAWVVEAETYADVNGIALIVLTEEDSASGEAIGLHLEEPYIDVVDMDKMFL